jgi:hypothetical protein
LLCIAVSTRVVVRYMLTPVIRLACEHIIAVKGEK